MPKFIGNSIPGSLEIEANAGENSGTAAGLVRITYAQARMLPPAFVRCSLDTTDRGGRKSLAKRWYRWFVSAAAIVTSPRATSKMMEAARRGLRREVGPDAIDAAIATLRAMDAAEGPVPCVRHDDCRECSALAAACLAA